MPDGTLKIILVTTTRAEWGILSPLARALSAHPAVDLTVAAGNMHLSGLYGHTIDEIRSEGFDNVVELDAPEGDGTARSRTEICAATAASMARLIERESPHAVVVLGDRYEILGAATAALIAGVPIVHLHGGEISEGAIDDSVRHAISKMATLHLAATALSAERLRLMGEDPSRIVHTGALGVENALTVEPISIDELKASLDGFDIRPDRTLLVTFHPVTRHPAGLSTAEQLDNLLGAIDDVPECNAIITFPNNDTGSEDIIERISAFADSHRDRVRLVRSLGKTRYLSALRYVCAVVGNSSSGLLEAPSTPAATIDIGPRQQGRERADSVIHVDDSRHDIAAAIRNVLAAPRRNPMPTDNPYFRPHATDTAVHAITEILPTLPAIKKFQTPTL